MVSDGATWGTVEIAGLLCRGEKIEDLNIYNQRDREYTKNNLDMHALPRLNDCESKESKVQVVTSKRGVARCLCQAQRSESS